MRAEARLFDQVPVSRLAFLRGGIPYSSDLSAGLEFDAVRIR